MIKANKTLRVCTALRCARLVRDESINIVSDNTGVKVEIIQKIENFEGIDVEAVMLLSMYYAETLKQIVV